MERRPKRAAERRPRPSPAQPPPAPTPAPDPAAAVAPAPEPAPHGGDMVSQAFAELDGIELQANWVLEGLPDVDGRKRAERAAKAALVCVERCRKAVRELRIGAAVVAAIQARDELADAVLAQWHLADLMSGQRERVERPERQRRRAALPRRTVIERHNRWVAFVRAKWQSKGRRELWTRGRLARECAPELGVSAKQLARVLNDRAPEVGA